MVITATVNTPSRLNQLSDKETRVFKKNSSATEALVKRTQGFDALNNFSTNEKIHR